MVCTLAARLINYMLAVRWLACGINMLLCDKPTQAHGTSEISRTFGRYNMAEDV
jgi:hypothetical protein